MEINKLIDCALLVDEDPLNGFLNAQLLSRLGIANNVKAVTNAMEAVEFIKQCCIGEETELNSMLVFLDIHSSAYDGMELIALINTMTSRILEKLEIIILSASPEQNITDHSKEYNIIGFIEKPLSTEKLQNLLVKNA